jgi:predicted DNA-binding transcriptional regulator AlpA
MRKTNAARAPNDDPLRELGYVDHAAICRGFKVAEKTGYNRATAGNWPPHYKLGREWVYRLSEVQAWIQRRRVDRSAS